MICTKCCIDQPATEFPNDPRNRSGKSSWCRACYREKDRSRAVDPVKKAESDRRHYIKHHGDIRQQQVDSRLRSRYGITKDDFDLMVEQQQGLCLICEKPPTSTFHVDHDHESGQVRGLLCASCNVKLGILEQYEWCQRAYIYLHDAAMARTD